jgi:hypothetical protein
VRSDRRANVREPDGDRLMNGRDTMLTRVGEPTLTSGSINEVACSLVPKTWPFIATRGGSPPWPGRSARKHESESGAAGANACQARTTSRTLSQGPLDVDRGDVARRERPHGERGDHAEVALPSDTKRPEESGSRRASQRRRRPSEVTISTLSTASHARPWARDEKP